MYASIGVPGRLVCGNLLISYTDRRRAKLQYDEGSLPNESWYRIICASVRWRRSAMPFWNDACIPVVSTMYPCLSAMAQNSDDLSSSPLWSVRIMRIISEMPCVPRKVIRMSVGGSLDLVKKSSGIM